MAIDQYYPARLALCCCRRSGTGLRNGLFCAHACQSTRWLRQQQPAYDIL
jgi:hypothetical protein